MMRSLYSAVSGINCNQKSMDVIGNNIANVNTIGFKTGRAVFQDMLSQTLSTGKTPSDGIGGINPRQVGTGAYLVAVDNIFTQGTIKNTARPHDIAIDGNGFFVVRGADNMKYYTRAGDVNFDKTGYLTTPSGNKLQGWMSDPLTGDLQYNKVASDIFLSDAHRIMPAKATTLVEYGGTLSTKADATKLETKNMLTNATALQNIFKLRGRDGEPLDLLENDTVTVKAHATGLTELNSMFDANGTPLNMAKGQGNIKISFANGSGSDVTLTYGDVYNETALGTNSQITFRTMNELLHALNRHMGANGIWGQFDMSEGRATLVKTAAAQPDIVISDVMSSNSALQSVLESFKTTVSSTTVPKKSSEMYFKQNIKASSDFDTLDDLSNRIENAINGHVVDKGFNVSHLDNNFGLANNQTFQLNFGGGAKTFTYSATPVTTAQVNTGSFHTLRDLANAINATNGQGFVASVDGEKLSINKAGAGAITFPVKSASPYLNAILNEVTSHAFSATNAHFTFSDIAGRGRLSYSVDGTNAQGLTGFSIANNKGGNFDQTVLMGNDPNGHGVNVGAAATAGYAVSHQFLTEANDETAIIDLFTYSGIACGFNEFASSIEFKAGINGKNLNPFTFDITTTTTLKDMAVALENYLGLGPEFNLVDNIKIVNGQLKIEGEPGESNKIDYITFDARPESKMGVFNGNVQPVITHEAKGGRFAHNMSIFDEQGTEHFVEFEFAMLNHTKNEWTVRVKTQDPKNKVFINGATTNELVIKFNGDGTPSHIYDRNAVPIKIMSDITMNLIPGNGAGTVKDIKLDLGTAGERDGLYLADGTSFDFNKNRQDGYTVGSLKEKLFNEEGKIIGVYSNGQIRAIGQLAIATFDNNQGLEKVGDTMFRETGNSGEAVIGTALTGQRGKIVNSALEQSNVDLSSEFVDMIVTQRGFQANSRVVTTSDEMIQELLNLKR